MTQASTRQWVLSGAHIASMDQGKTPYGLIEQGAVAIDGAQIVWVGAATDLPPIYHNWAREDLPGGLLTPALVDCHTHIVYGGDRSKEWEMRLQGASYADIARAGGGILSTVTATRAASKDNLINSAQSRLNDFLAEGLGMIEIKSGYGLDTQNECKMLHAARALGQKNAIIVKTSFLGAHALPPEFAGRSDDYIALIIHEMLPEIARLGLADFCDGFCENIAFSAAQMRKVLETAKTLGLGLRLHAEQLSDQGGAQMAAELGALSCDHLEYVSEAGIKAMAEAGTRAVLLPGAYYFLGETHKPPMDMLRQHGVPLALASDCNPGSSPLTSLLLTMNMGCTLFGMTPEEALAGVTRVAAGALGMDETHGTLAAGQVADIAHWDVEHPSTLAYSMGSNPHVGQIRAGQWVI